MPESRAQISNIIQIPHTFQNYVNSVYPTSTGSITSSVRRNTQGILEALKPNHKIIKRFSLTLISAGFTSALIYAIYVAINEIRGKENSNHPSNFYADPLKFIICLGLLGSCYCVQRTIKDAYATYKEVVERAELNSTENQSPV